LAGTFLLGRLSGYEAKVLIENSLDGLNTLCNTIALASATILALLLTLLGLSSGSKSKLKKRHYHDVLQIARLDTTVFIASLISFLVLNLPITEGDSVPENWFSTVYLLHFVGNIGALGRFIDCRGADVVQYRGQYHQDSRPRHEGSSFG
jgi:hypothetical protein